MDIEMANEAGGRVEQLSSLAIRSAERLSVSFRDFYHELIVPRIYGERSLPAVQGIPLHGTVDGMLQAAEMWSTAMNSVLGREDLRRTTMLSWRQALAPRALVRTHRAWCPVCLHELANLGRVVYEPLVWRVSDVTVCPHHCVRLEIHCPHCGKGRQPSFRAFARVGCCRGCGRWLGRLLAHESAYISELDMFLSRAVEDALSLSNVGGPINILSSDVAVRALRDVFFCGSSTQMGRALGVQRRQIGHFADGRFPAPLQLFVRASFITGGTMEQIFISNKFETDKMSGRRLDFEVEQRASSRSQLAIDLVRRLNSALADGGRMSVAAIADSLNITATTVWRRERQLASRLALMHAEFTSTQAQAQKEEYRAKVFAFVAECASRGVTPTRMEVDVKCGGDGQISSYWKRDVLKTGLAQHALLMQCMRK
jgi:hypothetical protein